MGIKMWKFTLIVETDDEDEVARIDEELARAACPVTSHQLTADHECAIPWMMIQTLLDEDEANEWRDDLNR